MDRQDHPQNAHLYYIEELNQNNKYSFIVYKKFDLDSSAFNFKHLKKRPILTEPAESAKATWKARFIAKYSLV